ncbi:hypothetical protein TNCV_5058231 [Trichonephila clavipes]|nr:hypothetical protein TNCV_5058231 [Trichonephila clavipes]
MDWLIKRGKRSRFETDKEAWLSALVNPLGTQGPGAQEGLDKQDLTRFLVINFNYQVPRGAVGFLCQGPKAEFKPKG